MKRGFYIRLAGTGIQKNRRLYVPFLLACIGLVAMYYIVAALAYSTSMQDMMGRTTMGITLSFGKFVITVFSLIFLFYTNSFLTRRRKKEFGLYNVLGMSKRHLAKILAAETVIVAVVSLIVGLAAGFLFSKLAELLLLQILREEIRYHLFFSGRAMVEAAVIYAGIFLVLLIYNVLQVGITDPLALMRSEAVGEKPPKSNWILTLAGLALLGGAYYLAVAIKDPFEALNLFFVAVLMVIGATYLLLISGSVTLCRFLQKRKGYYYRSNHFISVSSMTYRMKRAGAGLASICILSTMVLVTLSSTGCLYFGMEDAVNTRFPRSLAMDVMTSEPESWGKLTDQCSEKMIGALEEQGIHVSDVVTYHSAFVSTYFSEDSTVRGDTLQEISYLALVPLEDYNRQTGQNVSLEPGQSLAFTMQKSVHPDTVKIGDAWETKVISYLETFPEVSDTLADVIPCLYLVIPDGMDTISQIKNDAAIQEKYRVTLDWYLELDMEDESRYVQAQEIVGDTISEIAAENELSYWYNLETREGNRAEFCALYGGLFFLGLLLSGVFLAAAVLMLYYKQISEGYEDQARFGIMQKVGMTDGEIRKSVNSQILTVFFLPLLLAGIHMAFAFPMIHKVLTVMMLDNTTLLIGTTAVCYLAFAAFYVLVYKLTSNAYYSIVAGKRGETV